MQVTEINLATEARKVLTNRPTEIEESLLLMLLAEYYLERTSAKAKTLNN